MFPSARNPRALRDGDRFFTRINKMAVELSAAMRYNTAKNDATWRTAAEALAWCDVPITKLELLILLLTDDERSDEKKRFQWRRNQIVNEAGHPLDEQIKLVALPIFCESEESKAASRAICRWLADPRSWEEGEAAPVPSIERTA
jgi:hypothetical protein